MVDVVNYAAGFVAAAFLVTIYSLHELHRISAMHMERDGHFFTGAWRGPASSLPHHHGVSLLAPAADVQGACIYYNNTDLWGVGLVNGADFKKETAGECCDACLELNRKVRDSPDSAACNVWVWCGDKVGCGTYYQNCWLKWLPYARIAPPKDASLNASIPWTSGTSKDFDLTEEIYGWKLRNQVLSVQTKAEKAAVDPLKLVDTAVQRLKAGVKVPAMYHTITTVSGLYNQWQTRIHYYHWLKMKALCQTQDLCEMGGFTRLLHDGKPDNIMDEVPTVVVDPMPSSMLRHDDYVVLNRPYALLTWVNMAKIPERFVLMLEPDHILMRPLPNFMTGDRPAAFNFGYMNPAAPDDCPVVKRLSGIKWTPECESVAPIGNSPTFMTLDDLKLVMPIFLNMSMAVYQDAEAKKLWGWCQEMYAFAMSVRMAGIKEVDLYGHLMAQPPYDPNHELKPGRPFYILHYTYGLDFNKTTGEVLFKTVGDWHFDKREHQTPISRGLTEPPEIVDFQLARVLIRAFNEATAAIPCWNEYQSSNGRNVSKDCGEKPGGFLATLGS